MTLVATVREFKAEGLISKEATNIYITEYGKQALRELENKLKAINTINRSPE